MHTLFPQLGQKRSAGAEDPRNFSDFMVPSSGAQPKKILKGGTGKGKGKRKQEICFNVVMPAFRTSTPVKEERLGLTSPVYLLSDASAAEVEEIFKKQFGWTQGPLARGRSLRKAKLSAISGTPWHSEALKEMDLSI